MPLLPRYFRVLLPPAIFLFVFSAGWSEEAAIPNGDFEGGGPRVAGWEVRGDARVEDVGDAAGGHALRLMRDPVHLPETNAVSGRFRLAPGVWELSGAWKGDLHSPDLSFNVPLSLRFFDGAGREIKRKTLVTATDRSGWKKFRERCDVPPGAVEAEVAVEFHKTHGEFFLDGLSLKFLGKSVPREGGDRKTVFRCAREGFLFYPADEVMVEMVLETPASLSGDRLSVRWELTDFWGAPLSAPHTSRLSADGVASNGWNTYRALIDLRSQPLKIGPYYEVRTRVDLGAPSPAGDRASFAVLPEAATRSHDPMRVPFGAHTWNTTVYDFYPLAARLGLRRSLSFWNWPREAPYTPAFDSGHDGDSRLGWAKRFGMRPWGILYPVMATEHRNVPVHSDEALREGVRQSIQKYKKDGLWGFQIGNEPPSWNPEMVKEDVRVYQLIYEEIKKTDPNFVAIGSAIGPNEAFFKAGFQAFQDVYNIHGYNDLGELRKAMRKYRELFAQYGGEKPIWATEIGSNSQGLSRDVIARDLIRKVACFFADGGKFFTWFAVGGMPNPDGERSGGYSDSMDLFDGRYDMHLPRLDAIAYYHILNAICVKDFVSEATYPDGTEGFLFRDDNANGLLVFWNAGRETDVFVALPDIYDVLVTYYNGQSTRLDAGGKGINLRITPDPVMLAFHGRLDAQPTDLPASPVGLSGLPDSFVQGRSAEIVVRSTQGATPAFTAPPLWKISAPAITQDAEGARLFTYGVTPPPDTPARLATFQIRTGTVTTVGDTELLAGISVRSRIEVDLIPMAALKSGKAEITLRLVNNSEQEQVVEWRVELVAESPMENGTFDLKAARPASACFVGEMKGSAALKSRETREIILPLEGFGEQTLYKLLATATGDGESARRERLVGGFARVPKARQSIAVDGVLDGSGWEAAPKYSIDTARQRFVSAPGAKKWEGPEDLSGSVRFLWDADFLYVGVEVTDDIFANPKADEQIWNQDGVQFLVDPFRQEIRGKGRYDYAFGLGRKGSQSWCNLSADPTAPAGAVEAMKFATRRPDSTKGNMVYEIAIPWARLAPFKARVGANLGLAMILNEDDGAGRKSFMGWFGGVHLKETDLVGDLILGD